MNDRWIRNMQTREQQRDERSRLRRIIRDCEDGNFVEFSFLNSHYQLDSRRVQELIGEELRLDTYTVAREHYEKWLAAQPATNSD